MAPVRALAAAAVTAVRARVRAAVVAVSVRAAGTAAAAVAPRNAHRSNAQELIARVPVIEMEGNVAMCDGGGGATGHPIEFIQLDKRRGDAPVACKYCQLRFQRKAGHHGH